MIARIIDGQAIAKEIRAEVAKEIENLKAKRGVTPALAVVLVGDDPASASYVRGKTRDCAEVGIYSETFRLPADSSQDDVLDIVSQLNRHASFHGILVQLPLPKQVNETKVLSLVSPDKDVDCLHPMNLGKLVQGHPIFLPATPAGVQQMLVRSGYSPEGKHVVICGRSNIVGKPLAAMLAQKSSGANATVTVCHTGTVDLAHHTRDADILVVATGYPNTVTRDMVKEGAVVIDVGINRIDDPASPGKNKLVGDVDFEGVKEVAAAITPVPGGVGPMTRAMLLVNTLKAAQIYL